jgi:DnaJ-class molecular chaperone
MRNFVLIIVLIFGFSLVSCIESGGNGTGQGVSQKSEVTVKCNECKGTGKVAFEAVDEMGEKELLVTQCPSCQGTGTVTIWVDDDWK